MERSHRMQRVNELLRSLLGPLIQELRPSNDLITIITVDTAKDLKNATVIVSAVTNLDDHVAALNRVAPEMQQRIKPKLDFWAIPKLTFKADVSGEAITRVEQLLDELEPDSSTS